MTVLTIRLNGRVEFRIVRGLSFNVRGNWAAVRNQRFLPVEGQTDEEILLQQGALATNSEYEDQFYTVVPALVSVAVRRCVRRGPSLRDDGTRPLRNARRRVSPSVVVVNTAGKACQEEAGKKRARESTHRVVPLSSGTARGVRPVRLRHSSASAALSLRALGRGSLACPRGRPVRSPRTARHDMLRSDCDCPSHRRERRI